WTPVANPIRQLLKRLARRGWPVIHTPGAMSIWQRGQDEWHRASVSARSELSDNVVLDLPGRWVPRWQTHPVWDRFAIRHHSTRLLRMIPDHVKKSTTQG